MFRNGEAIGDLDRCRLAGGQRLDKISFVIVSFSRTFGFTRRVLPPDEITCSMREKV
jgi:hypothetical protein